MSVITPQPEAQPLDGKQLVLFDLDGTLVDSVPSLALAMDAMLRQLGREPAGEERARQWVGNGAPMLVARALSGDREVDPALDPELKQQALELFLQAYADCAHEQAQLYPGVEKCLHEMQQRGLTLALVTNKPARFIEPLLQTLGLQGHFELLLGGDSLSTKKPDPQPLHHCIDQLGSRPEATLMVGDSATDVQAARNAGVAVAAVSYGYSYPLPVSAAEPDWLVDCLTELL